MEMLDFDFDFDFLSDDIPIQKSRDHSRFDLSSSAADLRHAEILPADGESGRLISPIAGFSSCSLVMALSKKCKIYSVKITTLRVGKKELNALVDLGIKDVEFCLCNVQKQNANAYDYADYFENVCRENGYKFRYLNNHSKVILLDTSSGKLTIETSSNFNENPKIEQFCITNGTEVYDFYLMQLKEMGVFGDKGASG